MKNETAKTKNETQTDTSVQGQEKVHKETEALKEENRRLITRVAELESINKQVRQLERELEAVKFKLLKRN